VFFKPAGARRAPASYHQDISGLKLTACLGKRKQAFFGSAKPMAQGNNFYQKGRGDI